MRWTALIGLWLVVTSSTARSAPAAPSPATAWRGRSPTGASVELSLRPDHRAELIVDGVPYPGRWTETAGVRCVRLWHDEAPDVGCVFEAREGDRGYLVNEEREIVLRFERPGPSASELPVSRW